ncbi:ABC transporter substrate-binding protein [Facklamia sp. 7083-14-GEN3]|uniref:ABC transporter substrate-binding protein n=1 Tax=Facklamia sp. 7083-14-GEN3 TaxID=2973478 RepID=UPI00215D1FBD|nr:ABC transporter substrate-binding protein [Facklamia sp. 7083-14-GEN3]MCR8969108.1 ABC transporter substrate-binding protein [Facklamia sp. 7083-14-GEN3]
MKKIYQQFVSIFMVWMAFLVVVQPVQAAEKIDFILDWVPNTNHTGLYVAQEKGYFTEAGLDVTIRRPPEGSTTELVGLGQAQFGISFQDSLAARFAGDLPVTAVAAIIEHNTSGIISRKDAGIEMPADMEGKSYGTWNDPIELGMLDYILDIEGKDFSKVELVPNQADNSVVGLANKMFDSAWVYYAWDGVMADQEQLETNFWYFKDFAEELDFYSPVIIVNNDYLKDNPDPAKAMVQAIKKGYQFAMEHPEEAAGYLLKNAPELEEQKEMVLKSQEWLSKQYATDPAQWGQINQERWNKFYTWLFEHELVDKDLTQSTLFTNDLLGE